MSAPSAATRRHRIILPTRYRGRGALDPHEMPFTLLVVGELLGREDGRPIEDRRPLRVRADNLDKVKSAQKIEGEGPPVWAEIARLIAAVGAEPGVEIELLNASKADLFMDFDDSPTIEKSGLYKLLYSANYFGAHPFAAVLFTDVFDVEDRVLLEKIVSVAARAHSPVFVTPTPRLASSAAFSTLRASKAGAYLGVGAAVEVGTKLARDFAALGYPDFVGEIDPRLLVAARVAQNLKVHRANFMGVWRSNEEVEAGINAFLAGLVADPDDGMRPFRAARVRVSGPSDAPWRRDFVLTIEAHAGSAGELGSIALDGYVDME